MCTRSGSPPRDGRDATQHAGGLAADDRSRGEGGAGEQEDGREGLDASLAGRARAMAGCRAGSLGRARQRPPTLARCLEGNDASWLGRVDATTFTAVDADVLVHLASLHEELERIAATRSPLRELLPGPERFAPRTRQLEEQELPVTAMTAPEEGKLGSGILSDDVESKMDAVDFEPRLARMRSAPTVWAATHRFAHTGLFCMPLNTSPGIDNFVPDQADSTLRFPELAQVMNLDTSSPDLFESGILSTNDCATESEDSTRDWLFDTKMPEIPTPPLAAEVDSFSESLLKLDIPVLKQAPLSDQLRRLASDAARDGNEEIFALAHRCAEMLETGSTLRDVETCILGRATNASNPLRQLYSRLLETAIPRIQTQIMVNEAQLCEDEALREVCRELAAVRIAVVERAVEMVSFILDEDTAVLLCKTPTSSWVQTTVRWIVCRGQLRFARFYVVLVLPAPSSKDMAVLLSALCRLSGGGLATALRIVPDASAAARLLRHILCTQCNVSHSTLPEDPASWSTETAHEALLRSMPDMNALRACRFVKGSGQDGKAGDPCTALLPANAQSALSRFFTQPIMHGK